MDQWTIVAALYIQEIGKNDGNEPFLLACATSVKCPSAKDLLLGHSDPKVKVSDMHAKVLVRRAFNHFLLEYLGNSRGNSGENSYFSQEFPDFLIPLLHNEDDDDDDDDDSRCYMFNEGKYLLSFFVSHGPCGDATISSYAHDHLKKEKDCDDGKIDDKDSSDDKNSNDVKDSNDDKDSAQLSSRKRVKMDISAVAPFPVLRGQEDPFQKTCAICLKPGRTDSIPTPTMSCSDKLSI